MPLDLGARAKEPEQRGQPATVASSAPVTSATSTHALAALGERVGVLPLVRRDVALGRRGRPPPHSIELCEHAALSRSADRESGSDLGLGRGACVFVCVVGRAWLASQHMRGSLHLGAWGWAVGDGDQSSGAGYSPRRYSVAYRNAGPSHHTSCVASWARGTFSLECGMCGARGAHARCGRRTSGLVGPCQRHEWLKESPSRRLRSRSPCDRCPASGGRSAGETYTRPSEPTYRAMSIV